MSDHASIPSVAVVSQWVDNAVWSTPITDLHTHLYPPSFGGLLLYGVDELLTYHYLVCEVVRAGSLDAEAFYALPKEKQAEHVWQNLFIDRAPISEACRGVLTVLKRLKLDVASRDLNVFRAFFKKQSPEAQVDLAMKTANVKSIVMTNDPFDSVERECWMKKAPVDARMRAVLRIDPLLVGWPNTAGALSGMGYTAGADLGEKSMKEIRRFLNDWLDRMKAIYIACSLPPSWRYPDDSPSTKVLNGAILPICRERGLPMAMMIGVNKLVNPALRVGGDSLGKADIRSLEHILSANPGNKFLITMLSRENQHELAVTARKFRNLFLFGCWWFLNNPILIEEMTRMRMELLGPSFTPQHSDARVLEQIIYKWDHSRMIIAKVLKDKFNDIAAAGWPVTEQEVQKTVSGYLSENFEKFLAAK
jgi:hypothetical protein